MDSVFWVPCSIAKGLSCNSVTSALSNRTLCLPLASDQDVADDATIERALAARDSELARMCAFIIVLMVGGAWLASAFRQPPFSPDAIAAITVGLLVPFVEGIRRVAGLPRSVAVRDLDYRPLSYLVYAGAALAFAFSASAFWAHFLDTRSAPQITVLIVLLWSFPIGGVQTWLKNRALFHDFAQRRGLVLKLNVQLERNRRPTALVTIRIEGDDTLETAWRVRVALGQTTLNYARPEVETTPIFVAFGELDEKVALLRLNGIRIDGARGNAAPIFVDDAILSATVDSAHSPWTTEYPGEPSNA